MRRKKWLLGLLVAGIAAMLGAGAILAAAPSAPAPASSAQQNAPAAATSTPATSTSAYMGARIVPVTPPVADRLGLPDDHGALVEQVVPDSPAATGGLQRGDVIRSINGQTMYTLGDVVSLIQKKSPGDVLELAVLRKGENNLWATISLTVTLGEKPKPPAPPPLPLDHLKGLLPRLIQGDFQMLGPDDQAVRVTVTPGTVVSTTSTSLVIKKQDGQQAQFTVPTDARILLRGRSATLADLKADERVVVMQKDGTVTFIVATPSPQPPKMDFGRGRGPGGAKGMPDRLGGAAGPQMGGQGAEDRGPGRREMGRPEKHRGK